MGPVGHYLLRHRKAWNAFALESSLKVLSRRGRPGRHRSADGVRSLQGA